MSDSIEELEQDVLSLQNELESLRLRSADLKKRINKLKSFDPSKRKERKTWKKMQKQNKTSQ